MKVTQKKIEGNVVTLSVTASKDDVAKVLQMAQEGFARSMGLEPEKSKTPAQAAAEKLGIKDLDSVVAPSATEMLIPMALDKKNIIPAFLPKMEANERLTRGEEFKFTLVVTLKPEYELTSYDPVEIEVVPFEIQESDVDDEIERMTGSFTAYVADTEADPERPIEAGDFIKIEMEAIQDGEIHQGLSTDGRTYQVGVGNMPPSFEEQIEGMKVGEEKEFDFSGPSLDPDKRGEQDYIHTKVKVLELLREEKPVFDDNWVKLHMPFFKDAEEMRANVRKRIEMQARESYDSYLRQAVAVKLSERFEGKIEDQVYESMINQLQNNIKIDLQEQGKSWDDFVAENGGESQLSMMMMLQAREVITQGYALDAVFRHFKLTLDTKDVDDVCRTFNPNVDPKVMRQQAEQAGQGFALREMAERFKANQYALDNAKITYIEN